MDDIRMQGGLGTVENTGRADINNQGALSIAKVVKVYNENNTADVVLSTNNFIGDDNDTEGKITCIQLEDFAGWDDEFKAYYGKITPLRIGQLVVIGYIDHAKAQAVILRSFPPHISEFNLCPIRRAEKNIFPKEQRELISVTNDQSYTYQNTIGEFEKLSSSRAFFVGMQRKVSDARDTEFNYENLSLKNKFTLKTIGLSESQLGFKPFNYLAVTKDKFEDKGATFNRWYHDAEKGITRFTKDNDNRVFYTQLSEDYDFEIRSNLDTNKRDFETPPTGNETLRESDHDIWNSPKQNTVGSPTQNYSKIKIGEDGTIYIQREHKAMERNSFIEMRDDEIIVYQQCGDCYSKLTMEGGVTTLEVTDSVFIHAGKYVNITSGGDIDITAKGDINEQGRTINMNC